MKSLKYTAALVLITLLTSCGGGGGGGSGQATSLVSGVAAVGAPINGTVSLKDSAGKTKQTSTDPITGEFSIDIASLTPPFILRAQKSNGDFLYSTAIESGVANINPLSNVVMGQVAKSAGVGSDPNALYQAFTTYASKVTKSVLDTSTASVYSSLSTSFKAKLGNVDVNPIYEPFKIGNALDKAFDDYTIVYDSQSGYFQEKDSTKIEFITFGTLGTLSGIDSIAGNYTGEVLIGANNRGTFANIGNDGEIALYIDTEYVLLGKLKIENSLGVGTGVIYKLDSTGLSSYSPATAKDVLISFQISATSELTIGLNAQIGSSPSSIKISPNVNATFGNNLKGYAKAFEGKKLGPFEVKASTSALSGSDWYATTSVYLKDTNPSYVHCTISNDWTFQIADVEHSLYAVSLKETVKSTGYSWSVCPLDGFAVDSVGGAVFVSNGLLTILYDKASKDNVNYQYNFVAAKIFKVI